VFENNVFKKGAGDWDPGLPGNVWTNNRFDNGVVIASKRS
jgi:hypothetical protein